MTIPVNLFYNASSYYKTNILFPSFLNFFVRAFNFTLAFVISIILFRFIPSKKSFLTKLGENSLFIYLGHTYFISTIKIIIKFFI